MIKKHLITFVLSTLSCMTAFAMAEGEHSYRRPLSVAIYFDGTDNIPGTQEYAQIGYELCSGMSVVMGASAQASKSFHYAALDIHDEHYNSLKPYYQIGYGRYQINQSFDKRNQREGLMLSLGLTYPINRFAGIELVSRRFNDGFALNDDVEVMLSLGGVMKL